MPVFKYRPGFSASVPAQVVGATLERIRSDNSGAIAPKAVVDEARPSESEIHDCFEWDDFVAAEGYREDQARRLIRSVEVVYSPRADGEMPRREIAYVSVGRPFKEGGEYRSTREVMADPAMADQAIMDAISQLQGWRRRYGHLKALASVVAVIEELSAAVA